MNFTICKSLDDCTCENCINRTEFYVCRASPTLVDIDSDYWCSDGQWLCQYYSSNNALIREYCPSSVKNDAAYQKTAASLLGYLRRTVLNGKV